MPLRFTESSGTRAPSPLAELRAVRPYHLAIVVKNTTNPAWRSGQKAADDAAARFGLRVSHHAPSVPDDAVEQSVLMDTIVSAPGVDGIVLAPADIRALVPAVERANVAGIPVFDVGSRLEGGEVISYVGGNDEAIGRDLVDWISRERAGHARIVIIEGIRAAPTGRDRMRGIRSALSDHPGLSLLAAEAADYDRGWARELTAQLMQDFPLADVVLALNDEMALGAIDALRDSGRLGEVLVTGVNGTPDGLRAMLEGTLAASADYAVYDMVTRSMELAVRHLNGELIAQRETILPAPIIDRANLHAVVAQRRAWGLL